jgi:2-phosphoglycerate kinase
VNATQHQDEWKVLLIGGSSGVGKTVIAQELVHYLATSLLLADDVRLALQQVTTPAQQPGIHVFLNYQAEQWRRSESIRDDWIAVGQAMIPPLKMIMAHHIVVPSAGRIIIEGDGILPALAMPHTFADLKHFSGLRIDHEVRAVFITELDEEQILSNLRARGRGFETLGQAEQRAFAHASWLFGQWLAQEATARNLPVLTARPYESLSQRILDVL